ncbi:MAG: hypothetical protein GY746_10395 [Gammaproteobacteria bacterium]|nr:hypothetical protein [Gammaproteobacteria bacterium]
MNRVFGFAALLVAFSLIGGCASTPTTTSEYLADYERLQPGQYLEKFWSDGDQIQKTDPVVIFLGDVDISQLSDKKDLSVDDAVGWLKLDLENRGVVTSKHPNASLRADLAITYMDPGSAAKRMWAGELGAGHAQVQIEGKVIEVESGMLLASFAERRRSSGAIGLKDLDGDAGPGLVQEMIKLISEDVSNELQSAFSLN